MQKKSLFDSLGDFFGQVTGLVMLSGMAFVMGRIAERRRVDAAKNIAKRQSVWLPRNIPHEHVRAFTTN